MDEASLAVWAGLEDASLEITKTGPALAVEERDLRDWAELEDAFLFPSTESFLDWAISAIWAGLEDASFEMSKGRVTLIVEKSDIVDWAGLDVARSVCDESWAELDLWHIAIFVAIAAVGLRERPVELEGAASSRNCESSELWLNHSGIWLSHIRQHLPNIGSNGLAPEACSGIKVHGRMYTLKSRAFSSGENLEDGTFE